MDENLRDDFFKSTDRKNLVAHIKNMVEKAIIVQQDQVNERRERLHDLLQTELQLYQVELDAKSKTEDENIVKQRHSDLLALKDSADKKLKEFIEKKRIQHLLENSQEVRALISKRILLDSKASQLAQMEEKKQRFLDEAQS